MEGSSLIDRSSVAKDWHARGFSCGMWIDHAGREWRNTIHETDELFMAMSGELELEMNGERLQPSLGKEIHIPGGVAYTIRNIGGTTARWLYGQKRNLSTGLKPIESIGDLIHSPR
jgi:mannose-6-phosphate isomerase-like protein (cupin superfamily)